MVEPGWCMPNSAPPRAPGLYLRAGGSSPLYLIRRTVSWTTLSSCVLGTSLLWACCIRNGLGITALDLLSPPDISSVYLEFGLSSRQAFVLSDLFLIAAPIFRRDSQSAGKNGGKLCSNFHNSTQELESESANSDRPSFIPKTFSLHSCIPEVTGVAEAGPPQTPLDLFMVISRGALCFAS